MILNANIALLLLLAVGTKSIPNTHGSEIIRVFLLAGQSNMEGQGVVDLDHPKYYNGGKGILKNVFKKESFQSKFPYVLDRNGKFAIREDVFVRFDTRHGLKKGPLGIGFTSYEGNHHIGPEFQFGHVLGIHSKEPVLLVKTAWGGKSLFKDFRPPSSSGNTGEFYLKMIAEINEGIMNIEKDFPELQGLKPEISGFVWFQGWNDMFNESARDQYKNNLVNLITDLRSELNLPQLPVVIGELGNSGPNANKSMQQIRDAQKEAAKELGESVVFVKTNHLARPKEESPNVGHGHHWFGNAESYFLIGNALGKSMVQLIDLK